MHYHIDPVERAFEELVIGLELERVRHDTRGIRDHAIRGDDGITFDSARTGHGNHFTARCHMNTRARSRRNCKRRWPS